MSRKCPSRLRCSALTSWSVCINQMSSGPCSIFETSLSVWGVLAGIAWSDDRITGRHRGNCSLAIQTHVGVSFASLGAACQGRVTDARKQRLLSLLGCLLLDIEGYAEGACPCAQARMNMCRRLSLLDDAKSISTRMQNKSLKHKEISRYAGGWGQLDIVFNPNILLLYESTNQVTRIIPMLGCIEEGSRGSAPFETPCQYCSSTFCITHGS